MPAAGARTESMDQASTSLVTAVDAANGRNDSNLRVEAALRQVSKISHLLVVLLFADLILEPVILFIPYGFRMKKWSGDQVPWAFSSSIEDWFIIVIVRFVVMLALLRSAKSDVEKAVWVRRVSVAAFCYGCWRMVMLDLLNGEEKEHFIPIICFAALSSGLFALFSHRLVKASKELDSARAGSVETPTENATGSDSIFSGQLTYVQTLFVLKPYFWPSTGESWLVFRNRCLAISTWACVFISKSFNIMAPLYLSLATRELGKIWRLPAQDRELPGACVRALCAYASLLFFAKFFKEAQSLVYIKVQQAAYVEIADQTFAHLHNLSLDWHLRKKSGGVQRQMDRGIQAAQQTMQYVFLYLFPTLAEAVVVTFIFVFHFKNVRLATFVFMNLVLYAYVTVKITLWRKGYRSATTQRDNSLHERLNDSLTNYETIKYFAAEAFERREYLKLVSEYQQFSMATTASLSVLNIIQQFILNVCLVGGMTLAAVRLLNDDESQEKAIGDFVGVTAYIMNLFTPLNFLGTIYNMIVTAVVDMHNFGQLLAEPVTVKDAPCATHLDLDTSRAFSMVEFQSVCFAYRTQPHIRSIKDVSFQVPPGKSMALVGSTGAGKTTITRLLFRLFDVSGGRVLVNGQNVRSVTQKSLRQSIGMVPQDVVMFNDTVAHNIKYGRIESATDLDAENAAKQAQLEEFILQQEDGYKTIVGERGLKLSGGEKQRLAIARCLLKNPKIVVLDEATSALDSQTEAMVQQALQVLSEARTVIAIAHRLSTVRDYSEIVVLEHGEIIERGTHAELAEKKGSKYGQMWQRQAAGIMDETSEAVASSD